MGDIVCALVALHLFDTYGEFSPKHPNSNNSEFGCFAVDSTGRGFANVVVDKIVPIVRPRVIRNSWFQVKKQDYPSVFKQVTTGTDAST
jgi:hypothetical protein